MSPLMLNRPKTSTLMLLFFCEFRICDSFNRPRTSTLMLGIFSIVYKFSPVLKGVEWSLGTAPRNLLKMVKICKQKKSPA